MRMMHITKAIAQFSRTYCGKSTATTVIQKYSYDKQIKYHWHRSDIEYRSKRVNRHYRIGVS